jgi:hypothetical protein
MFPVKLAPYSYADRLAAWPRLFDLARILYDQMAHAGFWTIPEWDTAPEDEKDAWADVAQGIICDFDAVLAARKEFEGK